MSQLKSLTAKHSGIYTGVGSRKTPRDVLELMHDIAAWFASRDWTLRSGRAEGADAWFEHGCQRSDGKAEIYLPWIGFNSKELPQFPQSSKGNTLVYAPTAIAGLFYELAAKLHPAWDRCTSGAKRLLARNGAEVLGANANRPSDLLICWTRGGRTVGGTAQAIRIANAYNVPVFNLHDRATREEFEKLIDDSTPTKQCNKCFAVHAENAPECAQCGNRTFFQ